MISLREHKDSKIGFLQISDIHIKGKTDLSHRYLPSIAGVLQSAEYNDLKGLVVIIAGDVAFSGLASEYESAYLTLEKLELEIKECRPTLLTKWICMPGNHDCDFGQERTFRDMIINTLHSASTKLSNPDVITECLSVQESFNKFAKQALFESPQSIHYGLVSEYILRFGNINICIRCYNTAWVSENNERPGRMSFPRICMQEDANWGTGYLTLSILHHPPHWMLPNRKRLMSQHLDRTSDLILYGHEHLPEQFIKSDFKGNSLGIIYGGAFQEDVHDVPGHFNIITFDPASYNFKLNEYERKADHFERTGDPDRWLPIRRLSRTIGGAFEISESFLEWLVDTDADFSHPTGKKLSLEDVYVIPDFDELTNDDFKPREPRLIKGNNFLGKIHEYKNVIIYGEEKSGKTALSKYLFLRLLEEGNVPLYIDGKHISSGDLQTQEDLIKNSFNKCYVTSGIGGYDALPKAKKILIIDDFHKSKLNNRGRTKLLSYLSSIADTILVLGDKMMFIDEISEGILIDKKADGFTRCNIRELGRYSRRRLITQWYSLGVEFSERGEILHKRSIEAETAIDGLLGKSLLPRFAVFIMGFLSNLEAARQNKDIGTYGYIYESAITNSLIRGGTSVAMDIKYDFLACIAYTLYQDNKKSFSESDFKYYYRKFSSEIGRDPGFETTASELIDSEVLSKYDDEIKFKYPYTYFFFVARYFRDNLGSDSIRDQVSRMAKSLNVEANSNIWLFLVHQSKDQFLLDCIEEVANTVFPAEPASKLEEDIDFIRKMQVDIPNQLFLPDSPTEENIRTVYDKSDLRAHKEKSKENAEDEEDVDLSEYFREIESMIRAVVVLGQLIKNFPALKLKHKKTIVNSAFGAALRGLHSVLSRIENGKAELTNGLAHQIQNKYPSLERPEIEERVRESLFWIFESNVFSLIRLVSSAVGAVGEEATFREVLEEFSTKASRLIGISIGLDTLKIPRNDILKLKDDLRGDLFNTHILRGLVANHIYMFPVKRDVKAELCEKLGILVGDKERKERSLGYRSKKDFSEHQ